MRAGSIAQLLQRGGLAGLPLLPKEIRKELLRLLAIGRPWLQRDRSVQCTTGCGRSGALCRPLGFFPSLFGCATRLLIFPPDTFRSFRCLLILGRLLTTGLRLAYSVVRAPCDLRSAWRCSGRSRSGARALARLLWRRRDAIRLETLRQCSVGDLPPSALARSISR